MSRPSDTRSSPAGRRFTALKLLAKRKAFGKAGPVPCRVLDGEDAGEASLAENVVRLDTHPADQFEAFARLHQDGQGLGIEDIAARFGVSVHTVRQRLRLSAVSPRLLQAYRDEALTLDQVSTAVRIRLNPARGQKLARNLPSTPWWQQCWLVACCQRRQPPKAVAEGQRLQWATSQPQSVTDVGGGMHRRALPGLRCRTAIN